MHNKIFTALCAVSLVLTVSLAQTDKNSRKSKTKDIGKYADVNGLHLYYEIYGTGKPLVLLHGGLGAIEMFGLLGGGKEDGGWDGSGKPNAQLAVLPGTTHYTIGNDPRLAEVAIRFLDETK